MHAYLSEFVTYLIKFIFLLAVSVGGVFFRKEDGCRQDAEESAAESKE